MSKARTDLISHLRALNACKEALAWVEQTPGSPEDLWAACQRGDWMVWLLKAVGYDKRTLHHIACDCASGVLHIYERARPDDPRPRNCIAVARRYADGEATYDELIAARDAARAAVDATVDAVSDYPACAAARAAWCARSSDATGAAWWAATSDAARAELWDASAAPGDGPWAAATSQLADIIRARVSWTDVERAMGVFHG